MAFWKFGLGQDNGVDTLLNDWDIGTPTSPAIASSHVGSEVKADSTYSGSITLSGSFDGTPTASTSSFTASTPATPKTQPSNAPTLEQLLEADDLLQECKNGHSKLFDFLSTPYIVSGILDYVSGRAYIGALPLAVPPSIPSLASTSSLSGQANTSQSLAQAAQEALNPKLTEEEKERNRKRLKYPDLCTEILILDNWQVSGTIFGDTERYLTPFLDTILDMPPNELAEISVQAGHWSKVLVVWLSHARAPQLVQYLKTVPNFFQRMLKHLPFVSPIFDILVKLVNADDTHPQLHIIDWLHTSRLVALTLDLLNPIKAPAEAHIPASDFLRSIVAAASAASATKQQQQQQEAAKVTEINGDMSASAWSNWPNNALVRELASQPTIDRLLGYMLEIDPASSDEDLAQGGPSVEAVTSSVLSSLTVIIDLIRKNNADFTELQILQFLERAGAAYEAGENTNGLEGEGEEGFGNVNLHDQGPSLVDLEPLLRTITRRLPELHALLLRPRSNTEPAPTTLRGSQGQEPLTFERFRLCELYAELLHCSNMAVLNRTIPVAQAGSDNSPPFPIYDRETGRIVGTPQEAYESLSRALSAPSDMTPSGSAPNGLHTTEDGDTQDGSLPNRPVTAESDVTSSYDSEVGTARQSVGDDSDDVFAKLEFGTEDLSLEDERTSQRSISANPSPVPPSSATFGSLGSASESPALATSPVVTDLSLGLSAGNANKHSKAKAPKPDLPPGAALKQAFIDLEVIPAILDLFFSFPWNNFLHNVVYDLIQQIFNGKLETGLNRELCVAVFTQGKGLIARILETIESNAASVKEGKGTRLGHMGQLTLISEEIVKLLYNQPKDTMALVPEACYDSTKWEAYVENTLRETRERDLQPLGGGVSVAMHASASAGSGHGIGVIEVDDEFPQGAGKHFFTSEQDDNQNTSPDKAHFARYLASQISTDFSGPAGSNGLNMSTSSSSSSGSSSSDEVLEDVSSPTSRRQGSTGVGLQTAAATWFSTREGDSAFDDYDDEDEEGSSAFTASGRWAHDFDLGVASSDFSQTRKVHDRNAGNTRQDRFGFDDRFDSLEAAQFGSADSDDDEEADDFGPFSDSYAAAPSPGLVKGTVKGFGFDDDFSSGSHPATWSSENAKEKLTPADWNKSFRSGYDGDAKASFADFGTTGSGTQSPSSLNGDFAIEDDDDFGDFAGSDANNHGDYDFSQTDPAPAASTPEKTQAAAAASTTRLMSPKKQTLSRSISNTSAGSGSDAGSQVQGPGVHEGAHISEDGLHVEAEIEIDGEKKIVQVPRDELALHPDLVQ